MKKEISVDFDFGDEIELKTEIGIKRIVTGIVLRPNGYMYETAFGVETTWHQELEMQKFPKTTRVGGFNKNPNK
jgi:hypothetical protein